MATYQIPILNLNTLPDTSGNVYFEPAANNLQSNDRYAQIVAVFLDTATRILLGGAFIIPQNYVGTAKVGLIWATVATTGNADWEFDYKAIADGESCDPSTDDESVRSVVAAPGTARLTKVTEITLTSGNFAVGDRVQFSIARDGADADTITGSLYLLSAYFSYSDV